MVGIKKNMKKQKGTQCLSQNTEQINKQNKKQCAVLNLSVQCSIQILSIEGLSSLIKNIALNKCVIQTRFSSCAPVSASVQTAVEVSQDDCRVKKL